MFDIEKYKKDRFEIEDLIERWIFDEISRQILRRKLLDGVTFERLAEELDVSVKTVKNRYYVGIQKVVQHMDDNKYSRLWKLSFIRPSATDNKTVYVCWGRKRYVFRKGFGCVGWYNA